MATLAQEHVSAETRPRCAAAAVSARPRRGASQRAAAEGACATDRPRAAAGCSATPRRALRAASGCATPPAAARAGATRGHALYQCEMSSARRGSGAGTRIARQAQPLLLPRPGSHDAVVLSARTPSPLATAAAARAGITP